MARSKTLLYLRTRVRKLADIRQSQFLTDPEVDEAINAALTHVWDKLVSAQGERYCELATPQTITTIAGTAGYALPANYFKSSRFCAQIDGREYPLSPFTDREVWATRPVGRVWTILHYYVPVQPVLVADGDTFDGIDGWEELACLMGAIEAKQMKEEDPSTLFAQLAIEQKRLDTMRASRNKAGPFRMPDIIRDRRAWYDLITTDETQLPRFQLRQGDVELREGFWS